MRNLFSLCAILLLAILPGCKPAADDPNNNAERQAVVPEASMVPLRVWIVAPIADTQIFLRQWMSNSEQPLDIRSLSAAELLEETRCECDVLLYPARLVGELSKRGWIVKLPTAVNSPQELQESENAIPLPAAWKAQAEYARQTMAISLGCAIPTFVASAAFDVDAGTGEEASSWTEVLDVLQVRETDQPRLEFDPKVADREALVDRFLAIVATISQRDPAYGLLFDLQSMQSRLREPEFARAAGILAALGSQAEGALALTGSQSSAWDWALRNSKPAVAIASPALLDVEAAAIPNGRLLRIEQGAPLVSTQGPSNDGTVPSRPTVMAWNTGGGLLASISGNCRQSTQATLLLRWLGEESTRSVLAAVIPGIESSAPNGGADTLNWRARQSLAEFMAGGAIAAEPRLPAAAEYREALAEQLILFLLGRKNSRQALDDADRAWSKITQSAGRNQQQEYERSLGLSL